MPRLNSAVWRIVALHGIAIAAATILLPLVFANRLHATAETYEQRLLKDRLALVSHTLMADPSGRLVLPPGVAETVRGDGSFGFRVSHREGRSLLSSQPAPPGRTGPPAREETYFEVRTPQVWVPLVATSFQVPVPIRTGAFLSVLDPSPSWP